MRGCSSIHAICIATCSLGEVCRVLKPHEKCSQNFRSLLGDSTQTMYSGEKKKQQPNNITIKGKKQTKTTTLVFWGKKEKKRCYNIRPDYGEIQSILAADSVCVSLPAAYFDKQSRRWG